MRNLDDDQRCPPPASFLAIHTETPGRGPGLPLTVLVERHDLCESLATQLLPLARARVAEDGLLLQDVLPRCRAVLEDPDIGLMPAEIGWVLTRLEELAGQAATGGR